MHRSTWEKHEPLKPMMHLAVCWAFKYLSLSLIISETGSLHLLSPTKTNSISFFASWNSCHRQQHCQLTRPKIFRSRRGPGRGRKGEPKDHPNWCSVNLDHLRPKNCRHCYFANKMEAIQHVSSQILLRNTLKWSEMQNDLETLTWMYIYVDIESADSPSFSNLRRFPCTVINYNKLLGTQQKSFISDWDFPSIVG